MAIEIPIPKGSKRFHEWRLNSGHLCVLGTTDISKFEGETLEIEPGEYWFVAVEGDEDLEILPYTVGEELARLSGLLAEQQRKIERAIERTTSKQVFNTLKTLRR